MDRRKFVKNSVQYGLIFGLGGAYSCGEKKISIVEDLESEMSRYKLSLAQWSLHKNIETGAHDPMDFALVAKDLGFEGLEYVSQLYTSQITSKSSTLEGVKWLTKELKMRADDQGLTNVLVMVDVQKLLADSDQKNREEAILDHHKWIDMSASLGCKAVRINMFGSGDKDEMFDACVESLLALSDYAKDMNILIENHGGPSSDPHWLGKLLKTVDRKNCGTLPDFGNFCLKWKDGIRWERPCEEEYPDPYEAIGLMMPYAGGVSAKSYAFDEKGDETKIDYYKMMDIVDKSDFKGFVGVEFESDIPEEEMPGIKSTKRLLEKIINTKKG